MAAVRVSIMVMAGVLLLAPPGFGGVAYEGPEKVKISYREGGVYSAFDLSTPSAAKRLDYSGDAVRVDLSFVFQCPKPQDPWDVVAVCLGNTGCNRADPQFWDTLGETYWYDATWEDVDLIKKDFIEASCSAIAVGKRGTQTIRKEFSADGWCFKADCSLWPHTDKDCFDYVTGTGEVEVELFCNREQALASVTRQGGEHLHVCPEGWHIHGTHLTSQVKSSATPARCQQSVKAFEFVFTPPPGEGDTLYRYTCPDDDPEDQMFWYPQGSSSPEAVIKTTQVPGGVVWCMPYPVTGGRG